MEGLEQFCLCQALCLVLYNRQMNKAMSLPSENLTMVINTRSLKIKNNNFSNILNRCPLI